MSRRCSVCVIGTVFASCWEKSGVIAGKSCSVGEGIETMTNRCAVIVVMVSAVLFGISSVALGEYAEVEVSRHRIEAPPDWYGEWIIGTDYAEAGTFTDSDGVPLATPISWGHSNSEGEISGWSQCEAGYGTLKARTYVDYEKKADIWESYRSFADCRYTETIHIDTPEMWAWVGGGTSYYMSVDFHIAGSIERTGVLDTWADLWIWNYALNEGEEGMGWEPIFSEDSVGTYDETVSYQVWDYMGDDLQMDVRLYLRSQGGACDGLTSGTATMDFYNTMLYDGLTVYDMEDDSVVVSFDVDGNVTAGDPDFSMSRTPEPATLMLLGLGAVGLLRRKR